MKIISRFIIMLTVLSAAFVLNASAAEIEFCKKNIEQGYVTVGGKLDFEGDAAVIVQYLYADENTGESCYKTDSVYQQQTNDSNEFSIDVHIINYDTKIKINVCGSDLRETVASEEFFFPSYSAYTSALGSFKTYEGIKEIFENSDKREYLTYLNIDASALARVDNKDIVYRGLAEKAQALDNLEQQFDELIEHYEFLCAVNTIAQSCSASQVRAVLQNNKCIDLKNADAYDVFVFENLKDGFEDKVYTDLISDKGYSSEEEFYCAFDEAVILNAIENLLYWSEATKVLKLAKNALPADIDFDGYDKLGSKKAEADEMIALKHFDSVYDLVKAYNRAVAQAGDNHSVPASNGGKRTSGGFYAKDTGAAADNELTAVNKLPSFTDLDDYPWAVTAVRALTERGIVNGYTDTAFAPERCVTRAEFIKMLVLALGADRTNTSYEVFADVSPGNWYYPYVMTAYENELAYGVGESAFAPESHITREELATMLYRAMPAASVEDTISEFSDFDSVSLWAREAVSSAARKGIISGYNDGSFRPRQVANRAEAAAVIYRFTQILND